MKKNTWFKSKLEKFKDDFDFRLETLILKITESIAKRIKEKSLKRSDLANLLKVSPPAVTKILNGNSNFTLKTLLAISDALDLDLQIEFKEKIVQRCEIRSVPLSYFYSTSYGEKGADAANDDFSYQGKYPTTVASETSNKGQYKVEANWREAA